MTHVNHGRRLAALAFTTAVFLGCGSGPEAQPPADEAPATQPASMPMGGAGMKGMCPLGVEGTKVEPQEVEAGAAIAFRTTSGDVEELRRRIRRMGRKHGGEATTKGDLGPMVSHSMKVEDVEGGARVVLVPSDPAQLGALRERVRAMAAKMGEGGCPMQMMKRVQESRVDAAEHEKHHPKDGSAK